MVSKLQIGLAILQRDGKVLACHRSIHDAIWHAELGSSVAILNAGYGLDSLMIRYQVRPLVWTLAEPQVEQRIAATAVALRASRASTSASAHPEQTHMDASKPIQQTFCHMSFTTCSTSEGLWPVTECVLPAPHLQGVDWRNQDNWACNGGLNPYMELLNDGISLSPLEVRQCWCWRTPYQSPRCRDELMQAVCVISALHSASTTTTLLSAW